MGHVGNDIVGGGDAGPDARNDVVGKDLGESGDGMIVMRVSEAVAASEALLCVSICTTRRKSTALRVGDTYMQIGNRPEIGRYEMGSR